MLEISKLGLLKALVEMVIGIQETSNVFLFSLSMNKLVNISPILYNFVL